MFKKHVYYVIKLTNHLKILRQSPHKKGIISPIEQHGRYFSYVKRVTHVTLQMAR